MRTERKIYFVIITLLLNVLTCTVLQLTTIKQTYTETVSNAVFGIGNSLNVTIEELLRVGLPLTSLIGLEKKCGQLVRDYSTLAHVGISDNDGRILYHSDISQVGQIITDQATRTSLSVNKPILQHKYINGDTSYHVLTIPIFDANHYKQGQIRLGFFSSISAKHMLKPMCIQIINSIISISLIIYCSRLYKVQTKKKRIIRLRL